MGMDTLTPWLAYTASAGKGAFVLVHTSNEGRRDFEEATQTDGRPLYRAVADSLAILAEKTAGAHGYGAFGAVVGCTARADAAVIRARYPGLFFLIPGYGAQGGGAKDAAALLRNGNGGVVNASRSILCAWKTSPDGGRTLEAAAQVAGTAAQAMRNSLLAPY
jgi:orotidine-5'-phosphate decarboxylase